MFNPISAVEAVSGLTAGGGVQLADVSAASGVTAASPAQAADFARELGGLQEVPAAHGTMAQHVSNDVNERLSSLSKHLASYDKSSAGGTSLVDADGKMDYQATVDAVRKSGEFVFVATAASSGASQGGKTFNDLLKGQ